jgi:two-component system cell cycle response regulator
MVDMLESVSDGFFSLDSQWSITYFNRAAEVLLGRGSEDVLGHKFFEAFPEAKGSIFEEKYTQAMKEKTSLSFETYFGMIPYENWYEVRVYPQDEGISVYFQVTTERKQAGEEIRWQLAVNEALSDLYEPLISPSSSLKDIAHTVLERSRSLTGSVHGFVSSIDPNTGENVGQILTEMLEDQPEVSFEAGRVVFARGAGGVYPGLRGHALNTFGPFFTNSPETHPAFKGVPEGHIPIQRFLSVPVTLKNELVGQIALANKEKDYTERDLEAVRRLGELYALAIRRKRVEGELEKANGDLRGTLVDLEKANEKIVEQQKSLIQEERRKVVLQMSGATAHELNQPLTVLLGHIDLMRRFVPDDERLRRYMNQVEAAGQRIADIVSKVEKIRHYDTRPYLDGTRIINIDQNVYVLLVEDSVYDADLIEAVLKEIDGITVSRAGTVRQAIQILEENQIDLILLSYRLKQGNGLDLLSMMEEKSLEVPVILVTDKKDEAVASQIVKASVYDHFSKTLVKKEALSRGIGNALEKARLKREIGQIQGKLVDLQTTDELTGLSTRDHFMEMLERELARAGRHELDLSLCLVDLDRFGSINETYGYPTGDRIFSEISKLLRNGIRRSDVICRYGGGEFAVILPHTQTQGASIACERLRQSVAESPFEYAGSRFAMTVSIGIGVFCANKMKTPEELIALTEAALRRAKEEGRNRVVIDT